MEARELIVEVLAESCQRSVVGFQSEFVIQHVLLEKFLAHPDVVIETGTQGRDGSNRKAISVVNAKPVIRGVPRTLPKGLSIDFMIVQPFEYKLELKARSDFGSSDAVAAKSLSEDVDRVLSGQVDAFVLVIDGSIYTSLATNQQPKRIRAYDLLNYFPPIYNPGEGIVVSNGITNRWKAVLSPGQNLRIVAILERSNG